MQALLHSVPPTLQQATANLCLFQRLLDIHGQIWFSHLWDHCSSLLGPGAHNLLFLPSKSLFPLSCVSSGSSFVVLMATSSKRAYIIPKSAAPGPSLLQPEPLPLWQCTADPYLHRRHSKTVLSQSLWGLWVLVHTKFVWALWASLVGVGFDSKCSFASPTILLGASPLPLEMGYLQSGPRTVQPLLQCLLSWWGFSALGHGVSPHSHSSTMQPLL